MSRNIIPEIATIHVKDNAKIFWRTIPQTVCWGTCKILILVKSSAEQMLGYTCLMSGLGSDSLFCQWGSEEFVVCKGRRLLPCGALTPCWKTAILMGVNQYKYKWQLSKLMIDYQRITEATRKIIKTWCSDLVQIPNAFGNHFPCFKACAMAAPYTAECPFRFAAAWQWTVLSIFSL